MIDKELFIPVVINILIISIFSSFIFNRITSCQIKKYILVNPYIWVLILTKLIYTTLNINTALSDNENNGENTIYTPIYIKVLITIFYFIIIVLLLKNNAITFTLYLIILTLIIILDNEKYNTSGKYKNIIKQVQFWLSIASYIILFIGHLEHIGYKKYEMGKKFKLSDFYLATAECSYTKKHSDHTYWKYLLNGLGLAKLK